MSGRYRRGGFSSRRRFARARYRGSRFSSSVRRARGNQRAANNQNDVSNVVVNLMKRVKTGVTAIFDTVTTIENGHNVMSISKTYEIGTVAINVYDLLRQSEFYQSYANMYDQFRVTSVKVKVTPVAWKVYDQFNLPNVTNDRKVETALSGGNKQIDVIGVNSDIPVYSVDNNQQINGGVNETNGGNPSSKYIIPQSLTVVTAWDRSGLDDVQMKEIGMDNGYAICIGDNITTYSSAKSTQLVGGSNFNCVRYLYPSTQQEKGQYLSTSSIDTVQIYQDKSSPWWQWKVGGENRKALPNNLISDPACPFKPTFLLGILKIEELNLPNVTVENAANPEMCWGQVYPVTFNLEFDIGVTFRGLRKAQIV